MTGRKYLLDTDTLSLFYDNQRGVQQNLIVNQISNLKNTDQPIVSVLSIMELEYSRANAPKSKQAGIQDAIGKIKQTFEVLPVYQNIASHFGMLKAIYKKSRNLNREQAKKHNIDLMLAATAITENATLVSADKIYPKLAEINSALKTEDWTV